jgi:hypothetical protein
VCLADVAIQGLEIEGEFAEIFRLKSAHLQFDGDQAIETAMEEQQVQREISVTEGSLELTFELAFAPPLL